MANCPKGHTLYKCPKCGAVGCSGDSHCPSSLFIRGRPNTCKTCGYTHAIATSENRV